MAQNKKTSTTHFTSEAIEKIRNGDMDVFEALFRKYYHPLLQFAYRYVRDSHLAEDIVQDVFFTLWIKRQKLNPSYNIKTYLCTAVKNKSLKHLRHVKVKNRYQADHLQLGIENDSPEDRAKFNELQLAIEKSIQALPLKCRIIFCMNRFDNLKYSEIAEIQGISIKTVETQMGRALKLLRNHLKHFLLPLIF